MTEAIEMAGVTERDAAIGGCGRYDCRDAEPAAVKARGYTVAGDSFLLGGVTFSVAA
jgi:hypothetical protein